MNFTQGISPQGFFRRKGSHCFSFSSVAWLTELADEVVGASTEKVLTKDGASFVALVDARKLDYYHTLEEEHAGLVLLDEAEAGLRQLLVWHPMN